MCDLRRIHRKVIDSPMTTQHPSTSPLLVLFYYFSCFTSCSLVLALLSRPRLPPLPRHRCQVVD